MFWWESVWPEVFADLTCDVLVDDEDILSQISSQLNIPDFVDQEVAGPGSTLPRLEGLESGMLDDVLMDDFSSYTGYPDSGYSDEASVKSEPSSPSSSQDPSPPHSPVLDQSYHPVISNNSVTAPFTTFNNINNINNISNTSISLSSSVNGKIAIPKLSRSNMSPQSSSAVTSLPAAQPPPPLFLVCNQQPGGAAPIIVKTENLSSVGVNSPLITGKTWI